MGKYFSRLVKIDVYKFIHFSIYIIMNRFNADLYLLLTVPELRREVFSFLDKYDDDVFIFRQLSRSFYYMCLYEELGISKQPPSFLKKFLKINRIKKLHIRENHRKMYKLPIELFGSLEKITIDSMDARELYFFCKYFSVLPIVNLKIKYCTCVVPKNILQFNKLKTLDITITSKENEDIVFELLKTNKHTLRKLKIGVYTGKNVDEERLTRTIETHLCLETLEIRGDLFSYNMIRPVTKHIRSSPFLYIPERVNDLKYILTLRLDGLRNRDMSIVFRTLEHVEWVDLTGLDANVERIQYSEEYKYERIIYKPSKYDTNTYEPYDHTSCDVYVKSKKLHGFHFNNFTIRCFELSNPERLRRIYLTDVRVVQPLFFPGVTSMEMDNFCMDPEHVEFEYFQIPNIKELHIHCCLIRKPFVFKTLRSLNIQNSIVEIDMLCMMKQHKSLRSTLFYHNIWPEYDKKRLEQYFKSRKIEYYESNDW